jgi:4-hydroxybenzoyl-CoA thioesterase
VRLDFNREYPIRFAHCDAAGIAYYPRLLEICDAAVEDWTESTIGITRRMLHLQLERGLPAVDLTISFRSPLELGDKLYINVALVKLGNSSATLQLLGSSHGRECFRTTIVIVHMDLKERRAMPWPKAWRNRLRPHVHEEEIC